MALCADEREVLRMRVIVPPVLVGHRICRVVTPVEHLLEVQDWVGEWWEPSALTISEVCAAPKASEETLIARGVPAEDRSGDDDRTSASAIQTMMQASVIFRPQPADVTAAARIIGDGRRQKVYSGSRKFGRGRGDRRRSDRGEQAPPWIGPFRRATDDASPQAVAPTVRKRRPSTHAGASDTRV